MFWPIVIDISVIDFSCLCLWHMKSFNPLEVWSSISAFTKSHHDPHQSAEIANSHRDLWEENFQVLRRVICMWGVKLQQYSLQVSPFWASPSKHNHAGSFMVTSSHQGRLWESNFVLELFGSSYLNEYEMGAYSVSAISSLGAKDDFTFDFLQSFSSSSISSTFSLFLVDRSTSSKNDFEWVWIT